MRAKWNRSLVFCLLAILLCNVALFVQSEHAFQRDVRRVLRDHLAASLNEDLFSNSQGRVNDVLTIAYVGSRINEEAVNWIDVRWYAAVMPATILIDTIDEVRIDSQPSGVLKRRSFTLELPRNERGRTVVLSYEYSINWPIFVLLTCTIVTVYVAARRVVPAPPTAAQLRWIRRLVGAGYESQTAHTLVGQWHDDQLALGPRAQMLFDLIHCAPKGNFLLAMQAATDARVGALTELDSEWFAAIFANEGDIDVAWRHATAEDCVSIDLRNGHLRIRGREVPVTKTPLFYYAWYAMKRVQGEGWMTNPHAHRPDRQQGDELARLMWAYKGHAKAISELEEHGLRAKTLDQNRSKIKEELVAVLGPTLAEHYLFDTEKDVQGRVRYRVRAHPPEFKIVDADIPAAGLELQPA